MQKSLNLKAIYCFIYGALSLIVGGLFLSYVFAQKLGQFWLNVLFVNGADGDLSGKWLIVCLCSFVVFIVFSCWLGARRGALLSAKEKDELGNKFFIRLLCMSGVIFFSLWSSPY